MRALVDALPKHLFLLVGITPEARRRYFLMLPAFAGRFQRSVALRPLQNESEALRLSEFYLQKERQRARDVSASKNLGTQGFEPPLDTSDIRDLFNRKLGASINTGVRGLSQRDFLEALHRDAEDVIRG